MSLYSLLGSFGSVRVYVAATDTSFEQLLTLIWVGRFIRLLKNLYLIFIDKWNIVLEVIISLLGTY